ncbi:DNA transfer protein p32 [Acinetobacter indicus]|uniref:DNA transfer protein p32 n=1 Tax=Acinetobacter indicus TaxID=756892 RepID=UPI00159F3D8E|nr:DNA transfer protein p32 [Acinetobacter indicus]QLB59837.1 DNA transfer protein p32 [Acinetobacter indicus]
MSKVIGSITGANKQAKAAQQAANTQAAASKYASDMQKEMFDEVRADQKPYMQAGTQALDGLMGLTGLGGADTEQLLRQDPSYQFRLNQGLDNVQSSAAARGGLLSGATLKALNNYAQDYASQEYGNAYNRLSNIVGMGQNAAAGVGNAGMQTAQAVANNTMAGANAQAAGQIAAGNRTANNFQSLLGAAGTIGGLFI